MTEKPNAKLSRLLKGLKAAGVEHGARNKTVAEKAEYSENTVLKVLSGNSPLSPRFARAVCDAFGLDYRWVMEGAEPQGIDDHEITQIGARFNQPGINVDMLVYREYGGVVSEILGIVKLLAKEEQIDLLKELNARHVNSRKSHRTNADL